MPRSMKSPRIEVSPQVAGFLRTLAPEPRRELHSALRALAEGQGNVLELEHPLDGLCRLRVGRYRIVFHYAENGRVIRCDFAERRKLVYELFADLIKGS